MIEPNEVYEELDRSLARRAWRVPLILLAVAVAVLAVL